MGLIQVKKIEKAERLGQVEQIKSEKLGIVKSTEKIKEELADVFAFAFLIAKKYNFDVKEIVLEKIKQNAEKYPIGKSKGNATKYNEL